VRQARGAYPDVRIISDQGDTAMFWQTSTHPQQQMLRGRSVLPVAAQPHLSGSEVDYLAGRRA